MEPSSFVENEELSVFPQSEFIQTRETEREMQEEYEAEQKDIEEGVSALGTYISSPSESHAVKCHEALHYTLYN